MNLGRVAGWLSPGAGVCSSEEPVTDCREAGRADACGEQVGFRVGAVGDVGEGDLDPGDPGRRLCRGEGGELGRSRQRGQLLAGGGADLVVVAAVTNLRSPDRM